MGGLRTLLVCAVLCAATAGPVSAGGFDGEWIGGFEAGGEWVFVQARIGGEGANMTGRADLPLRGERDILLASVTAHGRQLTFELPGAHDNLVFTGALEKDGTLAGLVRQGQARSRFELLPSRRLSFAELTSLEGTYDLGDERVLLYADGKALAYVEYATGRTGRLFPLRDGRFVAGPTLAAGFPIDLTVVVERDASGLAIALSWHRTGRDGRRLLRLHPYRIESAAFESQDGARLSGRFLVPNTPGPHPAVLFVSGSGPTQASRLMPYADSLARGGVAVMIHDKRGVGASSGEYAKAGIALLAADATAGVRWLAGQSSVDAARIGLIGASLGGWVAPLAATMSPDVRFLIVEAAPSVNPAEHERLRVRRQMEADGHSPRAVTRALAFLDQKFDVAQTGTGWDALIEKRDQGAREGWLQYVNVPTSLAGLRWSWEHLLSYDPLPALRQLRIPILALYGDRDTVVDAAVNAAGIRAALAEGRQADLTLKVLNSANHSFLTAVSGGPAETGRLRGFDRDYFDQRVAWVLAHAGPPSRRPVIGEPSVAPSHPLETAGEVLPGLPQCGGRPDGANALPCLGPPAATYSQQP